MYNKKLKTWIEACNLRPDRSILYYLLFSHIGRGIILVYYKVHGNNKIVKHICRKILLNHYHIEVGCKIIGEYFSLPHPRNIIIAAESIGNHVQINQNVTIGGNMKKTAIREGGWVQKLPVLGNFCVIYTNSVVGGPVIIGDNVIIGSNCTCTHDIEQNTLVYNKCELSRKKIIVQSGSYIYT